MFTTQQKRIFLGLAVFFSLIVAGEAVKYLRHKDAVDLCNKVIGARLLESNISPYTYFWEKGDPLYFYNPYETIKGKVNSITSPPSMLLLMYPLSSLSFASAKWAWLLISYGMMIGSIFLFSRLVPKEEKSLVWSFSVFFFLASTAWLLHVERGQVYIVYLLLLCSTYYFYKKEQLFLSIACLSVLIWLRFPFIVFALPYFFYLKKFKTWLYGICIFIVLAAVTCVGSNVHDWLAYGEAVHEWSTVQILQTEIFADAHSETWRSLLVGKEEGRDYLINNSSLQYLAQYHLNIQLFPVVLWTVLAAFSLCLLYTLRRYFEETKKDTLFLVSFLAYIAFEICIPAPRYNYTYIQWLFPFLLLITSKEKYPIGKEVSLFLLIGLLLNMGIFFFIPRAMTLGEGILYLTLWWWLWKGEEKSKSLQPANN